MSGIGFPDLDELIREARERDLGAELEEEPEQERGQGEGGRDSDATDDDGGKTT